MYRWDTATVTGNTIFATEDPTGSTDEFIAVIETRNPAASVWNNNVYYDKTEGGGNTSFWVGDFSKWWEVSYANWKSRSGFDQNTQYQRGRPTGTKVVVLPNKYEAGRANVAVYNWNNASTVDIDVSNVLTVGQAYELRNVQHLLTGPVLSGVYDGRPLRVRLDDTQVTPPTGQAFTPESTSPSSRPSCSFRVSEPVMNIPAERKTSKLFLLSGEPLSWIHEVPPGPATAARCLRPRTRSRRHRHHRTPE